MDWTGALWTFVNSPAAISLFAGALVWALNKLYASKPAWAAYEGAIIGAVRITEKAIPNGGDSNLGKFDRVLQSVLAIYEQRNGTPADSRAKAALAEGINILHNQIFPAKDKSLAGPELPDKQRT